MSRGFHLTRHAGRREGDALDVVDDKIGLLRDLFGAWQATDPARVAGDDVVPAKWDHGTVGELLIEHSAVLLAAERDVARVLGGLGEAGAVQWLADHTERLRRAVDRVNQLARGVNPVSLAVTPEFLEAVDQLRAALDDELAAGWAGPDTDRLLAKLGQHRSSLRSARFIRSHAPSNPGPPGRYRHLAPLVRLKAAIDRLRGFPWGESSLGDAKLADRFDREE